MWKTLSHLEELPNIESPYDRAIFSVYTQINLKQGLMLTNVHSSIIPNSQKVKITRIYTNILMDKNMVYIYRTQYYSALEFQTFKELQFKLYKTPSMKPASP